MPVSKKNAGAEGPKRSMPTGRNRYFDPLTGEVWGSFPKGHPTIKQYGLKPMKPASQTKINAARAAARGTVNSQSKAPNRKNKK